MPAVNKHVHTATGMLDVVSQQAVSDGIKGRLIRNRRLGSRAKSKGAVPAHGITSMYTSGLVVLSTSCAALMQVLLLGAQPYPMRRRGIDCFWQDAQRVLRHSMPLWQLGRRFHSPLTSPWPCPSR